MKDGYPVLHEWKNFLLVYKFAIDEVHTNLTILSEEFHYIHDHNPIEHLKTRVKTPKSISAKLKRKGYEATTANALEYIHDIAGIRITCPFISDIYTLHQLLEEQHDIQVIEIKDYVKNPKPNGYQSYHMILSFLCF